MPFKLFNISLQPTVALPLQHEKQQEAEERRQTMLASVLQPAARERREFTGLVWSACADPAWGMQAAASIWMQEQASVFACL